MTKPLTPDGPDLGARAVGYRGFVKIAQGWNKCRVPVEQLEVRGRPPEKRAAFAARSIFFGFEDPPTTGAFYLDHVRVE